MYLIEVQEAEKWDGLAPGKESIDRRTALALQQILYNMTDFREEALEIADHLLIGCVTLWLAC
jgi:hypothetical protein